MSPRPPHPTISSGADAAVERFLKSVSGPVDLKAEGIFTVWVRKGKKKFPVVLNPDWIAAHGPRITGKVRRKMVADYLVQRDGNRCALSFPDYCEMRGKPFPHPEKANFDHKVLSTPPDNRLKNLQLADDPCNKHAYALQLKALRAVASAKIEREIIEQQHGTNWDQSLAMRQRWIGWVRQGAPVKRIVDGEVVKVKLLSTWVRGQDLAEAAPRALARANFGEEFLGVWKTYVSYIPMDSTSNGGPLSLQRRVNRETGKMEIYVKLDKHQLDANPASP